MIEVDGGYHEKDEQKVADKERQTILESLGLDFLRFADMEVRKDMPNVLKAIENYIFKFEENHPEIRAKGRRR